MCYALRLFLVAKQHHVDLIRSEGPSPRTTECIRVRVLSRVANHLINDNVYVVIIYELDHGGSGEDVLAHAPQDLIPFRHVVQIASLVLMGEVRCLTKPVVGVREIQYPLPFWLIQIDMPVREVPRCFPGEVGGDQVAGLHREVGDIKYHLRGSRHAAHGNQKDYHHQFFHCFPVLFFVFWFSSISSYFTSRMPWPFEGRRIYLLWAKPISAPLPPFEVDWVLIFWPCRSLYLLTRSGIISFFKERHLTPFKLGTRFPSSKYLIVRPRWN